MTEKDFIEPEWDTMYVKMLDAIIEYMDKNMATRENSEEVTPRDVTIIRALVEFYDFEVYDNQDLMDIMEDVAIRSEQLEDEEKRSEH